MDAFLGTLPLKVCFVLDFKVYHRCIPLHLCCFYLGLIRLLEFKEFLVLHPHYHILLYTGVGNRRENFISFQQFLSPRGSKGANIEPGFMAPYFMEEKPCAAKKNRRRENPVALFTNEDCSETVFLPSQKRKRANAKASGNDGKLAIHK